MKKIAALFTLSLILGAYSSHAQNSWYWDANGSTAGVGGTGNWTTTGTNWTTNSAGNVNTVSGGWSSAGTGLTNFAIFQGTNGTVTIGASVYMNQLYVNTDGYTLVQGSSTANRYIYATNAQSAIILADGITLNLSGSNVPTTGAGALGIIGNITNTGSTASTIAITGNTGTTPGTGIRILSRVTTNDTAGTNIWSVNLNIKATGTGGVIFSSTATGSCLTFRNPITVDNGSRLVLSPGSSVSRIFLVSNSIVTSAADALAIGETGNTGLVVLRHSNNVITGNLNVIGQLGYQGSLNALGTARVVLNQGSTFGQSGTISGSSETITNPITIQGDTTFGSLGNSCYFGGNIDLAAGTRTVTMANSTVLSGAVTNGSLVYTNSSSSRSMTFSGSLNLTNLSIMGRGTTTLGSVNVISNLVISNSFGNVLMTAASNKIESITVNAGSLSAADLGNGTKSLTLTGVGATATFSNTAASNSLAVGPLTLGGSNNIVMATSGSTSIASSGAITLSGSSNVITLNGSVLASGVTYPLITGTSVNTNGLTGPVTLTGAGVNNAVNLTLNGDPVISGNNTYTFRSTATALELQVDQNLVNNYSWSGGATGSWNTDPANTVWTLGGSSVGFTSGSDANAAIDTTSGSIGLTVDAGGISAGYVTVTGGSGATLDGGNLSALGLTTTSTALTVNSAVSATNFSVTNSSVSGSGSISTVGGTTVQCDTDQSLSVAITGTGGVTKSGAGTLTVSGGSTYTGNLVVNSGALATSGSSAIPDNATLVLSNAATLNLGGNETVGGLFAAFGSFINLQQYTLTAGGNNSSYTNGATITGTGGIVKNGTGIMYMNTNGNTFSGGFTLNAGEVQFTSSGTASGGSITSTMFGTGPLTLNGGIFGSSSSNSGRSVHNSVVLNGSVQFGSTAWGTSTTNLNAGTPNLTFTTNGGGTTTLQSDSTISTIGSVQWDQKLSGNFRLTKTGVGASSLSNNYLTLRASNNISGVTVVSGSLGYKNRYALGNGTLNLKNGVVLGQEGSINNSPLTGNDQVDRSIPNPILVDGDVTFGLGGTGCYFAGDIDLNGGSRTLTLANSTFLYGQITNGQILTIDNGTGSSKTLSLFASNTYAGGTVVRTNAALAVGHNQALGNGDLTFTNTSGSGVAILRAATLSTAATQVRTIGNNINLASGMTVTLDSVTGVQDSVGTNIPVAVDMVLTGNISGGGGLTKSGSNTVTLTGAETYTGATAVQGGKLVNISSNLTATITTNTVAVTFSNTPANGTYAILPGALTGNYTLTDTMASSTQMVTLSTASPASVTVASKSSQTINLALTDTKTYGAAAYTLSVTKGASSSPLTFESSNTNVATVSTAGLVTIVGTGSTTIRVNQAGDDNYLAATEVTQVLTVATAALPAVTFTPPLSLVYDGSAKTHTASATGPSGLTLTYTGRDGNTYNSSTAPKTVGLYTVTATSADPNYTGSRATNFSITPKGLTITGATATSRAYNAGTNVVVSGGTLEGIESGDTVTLDSSGVAGTVAGAAVGTAKAVTVTGYSLGGADAGNYSLTQPTGLTVDITAKSLTITGATATSRPFNGTTNVVVGGGTLVGVESGDSVTLGGSPAGTVASPAVGNSKAVTVTGYTISGTDSGNYSLSQPTGLTVDITAAGQSISDWLGGAATNSENVGKYLIGGATNLSAAAERPAIINTNSTNLILSAIVRTNDPKGEVVGQWVTNVTGFSALVGTNNQVNGTRSANQSGLDSTQFERREFSVPRTNGTNRLFLRLKATLNP